MTLTTAVLTGFGISLGFAGAFGGVGAFLIVLVLGTLGLFVGRVLEGEIDLAAYVDRTRRPR